MSGNNNTKRVVRQYIKELLMPDDATLKKIADECKIVDILIYAGNISSLLFIPLIKRILPTGIEFYDQNMFIYAMDSVVRERYCLYLIVPFETARVKVGTETLFLHLLQSMDSYYYDNDNIVMVYRIPDKHRVDYDAILSSNYTKVSKEYVKLCDKDGIAYAVFNNSKVILSQWQHFSKLIQLKEGNDIISEDRCFPEFNLIEKETYYAQEETKNKKREIKTVMD